MVHGHQHHSVPEQERSLRGEDTQVAAHHMLSGIYGYVGCHNAIIALGRN